MESTVFEPDNFNPKQCYYALKSTLRHEAKNCLLRLEQQLEVPNIKQILPSWFSPTSTDYQALYFATNFVQLSYPLRLVIVIAYFHRKFQPGSAKLKWHEFLNMFQFQDESISQWTCRMEEKLLELKSFNIHVPFKDYLEQWCSGTRKGFFLTSLQKAKNPVTGGAKPLVHDMQSFQNWKTNILDVIRQTQRENERRMQLHARYGRASNTGKNPSHRARLLNHRRRSMLTILNQRHPELIATHTPKFWEALIQPTETCPK